MAEIPSGDPEITAGGKKGGSCHTFGEEAMEKDTGAPVGINRNHMTTHNQLDLSG